MPYRASGQEIGRLKLVSYASLVVGVASMLFVAVLAGQLNAFYHQNDVQASTTTTTTSYQPITVSGSLITPAPSLAGYPVVTAQQPFGSRLTDINEPLNASELAVIDNASQSYFVTAAQMYLNKTLSIPIGAAVGPAPLEVVNGKPSVIYLGAISCVYCGENRWAMALALGQFGSFSELYKGYSAFSDANVPTLYWAPAEYNVSQGVVFGNFYTSNYVNFLSIDYQSPITGGFEMGPDLLPAGGDQHDEPRLCPSYQHHHQAQQLRRHSLHDMGQVQRARSGRAELRGRLLQRDDLAPDGVAHARPGACVVGTSSHALRLERVRRR